MSISAGSQAVSAETIQRTAPAPAQSAAVEAGPIRFSRGGPITKKISTSAATDSDHRALTTHAVDDGSQAGPVLDQVAGPVVSFTGDGAYDQDGVYASVAARHPEAEVIVPPRATAVPSQTAERDPTQRDHHLQHIAEHGRMAWQRASGYTKRARAEAAIGRWKP